MAKRSPTISSYIRLYRRYKRGKKLNVGLQMRLSDEDKRSLEEIAEYHGLSCSEMVRVLLFREAHRQGLISDQELERGNHDQEKGAQTDQ